MMTSKCISLLATLAFALTACQDSTRSPLGPSLGGTSFSKGSSGGGDGSGSGGGTSGGGKQGGGGADSTPPAPPRILTGPLYIRESFGADPQGIGNTVMQRFRADGTLENIGLGTSLNDFRVESPSIASETWSTLDPEGGDTWAFAGGSSDPNEPPSSYEQPPANNGVAASAIEPPDITNNDALLNFLQPSGPVTASITMIGGPYAIAVGFTPSGALTGNFETSGAAWLVVKMPRTNWFSSPSTWELHTNGMAGPSATGTFMASSWNRLSLRYDPAAGAVSASVQGATGAASPTLTYAVSGVRFVGFQGNGIVNDFRVEAK